MLVLLPYKPTNVFMCGGCVCMDVYAYPCVFIHVCVPVSVSALVPVSLLFGLRGAAIEAVTRVRVRSSKSEDFA